MYCGDVRGSWHVLWGCEGVSSVYCGDVRGSVACTVGM